MLLRRMVLGTESSRACPDRRKPYSPQNLIHSHYAPLPFSTLWHLFSPLAFSVSSGFIHYQQRGGLPQRSRQSLWHPMKEASGDIPGQDAGTAPWNPPEGEAAGARCCAGYSQTFIHRERKKPRVGKGFASRLPAYSPKSHRPRSPSSAFTPLRQSPASDRLSVLYFHWQWSCMHCSHVYLSVITLHFSCNRNLSTCYLFPMTFIWLSKVVWFILLQT